MLKKVVIVTVIALTIIATIAIAYYVVGITKIPIIPSAFSEKKETNSLNNDYKASKETINDTDTNLYHGNYFDIKFPKNWKVEKEIDNNTNIVTAENESSFIRVISGQEPNYNINITDEAIRTLAYENYNIVLKNCAAAKLKNAYASKRYDNIKSVESILSGCGKEVSVQDVFTDNSTYRIYAEYNTNTPNERETVLNSLNTLRIYK